MRQGMFILFDLLLVFLLLSTTVKAEANSDYEITEGALGAAQVSAGGDFTLAGAGKAVAGEVSGGGYTLATVELGAVSAGPVGASIHLYLPVVQR
ncbi:MAG: hypothetical protein U0350_43165 [Caldilineaceae bacterium]